MYMYVRLYSPPIYIYIYIYIYIKREGNLAGAVEYTGYFQQRGKTRLSSVVDMTPNNLMLRLQ